MSFIVLRVTALATLVHFSQVTPGLFCTFKQLPPSTMIKISGVINSTFMKNNIEDCMKMCYEYPPCVYIISYGDAMCTVNPLGKYNERVDSIQWQGHGAVAYQLDRSVLDGECPAMKEWLALKA